MGTNRYLLRPEVGTWVLEHNGKPIDRFPGREAALAAARTHARREDGEVVIVDEEGFFVDHERYGSRGGGDPVG